MTQVPRSQQIGAMGETIATLQFQELDWGPVPIGQHDNGTDLLVQIRDDHLVETGAILGVQTKAGLSYFSEPYEQDGETGWIFRTDPEHRDYWVNHQCPHIIVLVDKKEKIAYWEKITPEKTISTGKNWKILVPSHQKLDLDSKNQLFQYGVVEGNRSTWEGTAWGGKNRLREENQLRAAFLTPRLLSPHVNEGRAPADYLEAISGILAGRISIIAKHGNRIDNLEISVGGKSTRVIREIYYAVKEWFTSTNTDDLHNIDVNGGSNAEIAALTVCQTVAYREAGQYREAKEALNSALLSPRRFSGGDYAWLLTQYAGIEAELGNHRSAKLWWDSVFALCARIQPDPTIRALLAMTVSALLSSRNRLGADRVDLKEALNTLDNQAYLWVAQLENRGLAKNLVLAAKSELQDRSIMYGSNDISYISLRAASMVRGFLGDFHQWRFTTRLLVFHLLVSYGGRVMGKACARWARQCLPADELRQFFSFSVRRGVHEPLVEFAQDFNAEDMTVSSVASDLELISEAADYLDLEKASILAEWALKEIESNYPTLERLGSFAGSFFSIRKLLADLYPCSDEPTRNLMREHLLRQLPVQDEMAAQHYSRLLRVINPADWSEDNVAAFIRTRVKSNHTFCYTVESVFMDRDKETHSDLSNRMQAGDVSAYLSVGADGSFPREAFQGVISKLDEIVEEDIKLSEQGVGGSRTYSAAAELCRLSLIFPEDARWDTILKFADPNFMRAEDTALLLHVLIGDVSSIPYPLRDKFATVAASWMSFSIDEFFLPSSHQDRIRARAAHLYFRLNDELFTPAFQGQMLAGNLFEVQEGLLLSEELEKLTMGMLAMFISSGTPEIRRTAVGIATRQWLHNFDRNSARSLLSWAREHQPLATEITMLNSVLFESEDCPCRDEILTNLGQSQFLRIRERAIAEIDAR